MSFTKIEASGLDVGPLSGNRNRIINGDMRIAQRGTSFVSPAANTYNLDRFLWGQGGTMAVTITQSTDVPNDTFQNSLKVDVTTADTSIASNDYSHILQKIEGYNVRDLIGQTFTLSFWVKSPKTGVHCVSFRNSFNDRSYVSEYTVITANTWEYKTITVIGGLITAGTWNWTNGTGLDLCFTLVSGTTFQTTAGSWQVGNFIATSNQVNVMDNVANDFFLTGVQLEVGTVATPFERRPYGTELALCQRYFELVSVTGSAPLGFGVGQCTSTTTAYFQVSTFTPKRVPPVATLSAGTTFAVVNSVGNLVGGTGASILNYGLNHPTVQITVASGLTAGNSTNLYANGPGVTASISISSEL
jgi:hypothetical protein